MLNFGYVRILRLRFFLSFDINSTEKLMGSKIWCEYIAFALKDYYVPLKIVLFVLLQNFKQ